MIIVAVLVVLGALIGAFLMWAVRMPPTRPRPGSRYRGHTFTTIDDELRSRRRR